MTTLSPRILTTLNKLHDEDPKLIELVHEFTRWLEAFPGLYDGPSSLGALVTEVAGRNANMLDTVIHARQRLRKRATELRIWPPTSVICEDGAPTDALLNFCKTTDTSLDWVFQ